MLIFQGVFHVHPDPIPDLDDPILRLSHFPGIQNDENGENGRSEKPPKIPFQA